MDYAAASAAEFVPTSPVPDRIAGFFENVGCDPIATIRTLIRVVSDT